MLTIARAQRTTMLIILLLFLPENALPGIAKPVTATTIDASLCMQKHEEKFLEICLQWMALEESRRQNIEALEQNKISRLNLYISLFVAALTLLVSVFTIRFSIKSLKETTRLQNAEIRSYVGGISPTLTLDTNSFYKVGVKIKNTGATAAKKVRTDTESGIFPAELPEDFKFPTVNPGRYGEYFIFPGEEMISYADRKGPLTEFEIDGINNKKQCIYIWGEVHYTDVFGNNHLSTYVYRLDIYKKLNTQPPQETDFQFNHYYVGKYNTAT